MGRLAFRFPAPRPRPTGTDPGPVGHVRRKSREVGGGEGSGWAASRTPSDYARALLGTGFSAGDGASSLLPRHVARIRCLPYLGRHLRAMPPSGITLVGVPKYFCRKRAAGAPLRRPLGAAREWAKGSRLSFARARRRELLSFRVPIEQCSGT
jgi:hypothetical protein